MLVFADHVCTLHIWRKLPAIKEKKKVEEHTIVVFFNCIHSKCNTGFVSVM